MEFVLGVFARSYEAIHQKAKRGSPSGYISFEKGSNSYSVAAHSITRRAKKLPGGGTIDRAVSTTRSPGKFIHGTRRAAVFIDWNLKSAVVS
ncbi:hypothetical protein HUU39_24390 [candidate division KSB1 bacterium]|nr:hypothetical protein [bacterium]NUM68372.1 hypothetical protein [candidate division KSB1 bacterium]